jgi:hypothetical protein
LGGNKKKLHAQKFCQLGLINSRTDILGCYKRSLIPSKKVISDKLAKRNTCVLVSLVSKVVPASIIAKETVKAYIESAKDVPIGKSKFVTCGGHYSAPRLGKLYLRLVFFCDFAGVFLCERRLKSFFGVFSFLQTSW